ncbi:hypothetical protein ACTTAI_14095 [Rhodobacter capsulatus]|uniref:hypothetical protein n=1 Tax=Rhodobacter capsulatus TaxID=1061 RepID=UPI0040261770
MTSSFLRALAERPSLTEHACRDIGIILSRAAAWRERAVARSSLHKSKSFYCDVLGFDCVYERAEEGFCYLRLGEAEVMIDQIGQDRTFDAGQRAKVQPDQGSKAFEICAIPHGEARQIRDRRFAGCGVEPEGEAGKG